MPYPYDDATGLLISGRRTSTDLTRPNNTTAYAVGDVVNGNGVTVPIVLNVGGGAGGEITHVRLEKSNETLTNATFRVHFLSGSFTIPADNAQMTALHANRAVYLGYVDLATMVNDGAGSNAAQIKDDDLRIPFPGTVVYAVITCLAAYTPAAQEVFNLGIGVRA